MEGQVLLSSNFESQWAHVYVIILFYLIISQIVQQEKKNESQARNRKKMEEPYIWAGQNKFKKKILTLDAIL